MITNYNNPSDRRHYPERWPLRRAKDLFTVVDERSQDGSEELLTVSHKTGITPRKNKNVSMFMAENLTGYKKCAIGDIPANIMWMWQGAIGVSKYEGIVSPAYYVYRQKGDFFNPRYLDLLLREKHLVDVYHSLSTGLRPSRLRLYPEQFFTIDLPVPPRDEQEQIVRFLDWKCSKINQLINLKQQQLTHLQYEKRIVINNILTHNTQDNKTPPISCECINDIPDGWEFRPLKHFVTSNDESLSSKTDPDIEINYIDISTTGFGYLKKVPEHMFFSDAPSRARRIVRNGDTIISTVRTYLKSICYIDNSLNGHIASTGFSVLRPRKNVFPKLLSYALCCDYFINQVIKESTGTSYPAINDQKLLRIKVLVPTSLEEQKALYRYLENQTSKIDSAIDTLKDEISVLYDLKTSLITDVITGGLDVRHFNVPDFEYVEEIFDKLTDDTDEDTPEEE